MVKPGTSPEFDKAVLWKLVKDDPEFIKYLPESIIGNIKRIPKVWFWRVIYAYDPVFANNYTAKVMDKNSKKQLPKKRKTILISDAHNELLERIRIRPS